MIIPYFRFTFKSGCVLIGIAKVSTHIKRVLTTNRKAGNRHDLKPLGDRVILKYQKAEEKNTVGHYPAGQYRRVTAGSGCCGSRDGTGCEGKNVQMQVKEGAVIVNKVREKEAEISFDAVKEEYVDMLKEGIIDPVKVTKSALENAVSISATMLTTEAAVAEVKEKRHLYLRHAAGKTWIIKMQIGQGSGTVLPYERKGRGNEMRSYLIDIPSADKLRELVRIVNQFPCEMNLKTGLAV